MFSFETKKIRALSVICIVVISLFLMIFIISYYSSIKKILTLDTEESMSFVAEVNLQAVKKRIQAPLEKMLMVAEVVASTNSPEEVIDLMSKSDNKKLFADFTWIEPDLSYYTSVNKEIDIKMSSTLKQGFAGQSYIAYTLKSPVTEKPAVLYGVPVRDEGKVRAVIVGSCEPKLFSAFSFMNTFEGKGNNYLIDEEGNIIASSFNSENIDESNNFFESFEEERKFLDDKTTQKIYETLHSNEKGSFIYKNGEIQVLTCYEPIGIQNWFLFSSMPFNVVTKHYVKHSLVFAILCIFIIIGFSLVIISMVNRSGEYRTSLEHALYTDPVTGGMSHSKFEKLVREIIQDAPPYTYTFISLDIHSFKLINDINGGGGGNATLMYMYSILSKYLIEDELMCRVDADIFNLLVHTKPEAEMEKILSDFTEELNSFNKNKKDKYYLRIKAGFYIIPNGSLSFMMIRDRSNIARKMAKQQQSSKLFTYDIFDEKVLSKQTKEREFENMMEQSLQNNEFKMYLQPKINIQTGEIAGAEALVRWESPIYGLIRPDSFIPMFERNGFIVQVDLNIFEQVCAYLRSRIDRGLEPIHISVNLSRTHLYNENFMADYIAIRNKYNIPASFLEFEITESMAFEQLKSMEYFINKIHETGFSCSIDDFGSGFSSLNVLSDIPADVLKLDRIFFKVDSNNDIRNKQIIASVISLAKKLNMKVVAEGIETIEQANFLQEIKCDIIQGFIYSKPLPVIDFEKFLDSWDTEIVTGEKA